MICGKVDGSRTDLHDVTLFYFLRTIDEGIPNFDSYMDCDEQITQYLVVGSLQGKFLVSLNRMLVEVEKHICNNLYFYFSNFISVRITHQCIYFILLNYTSIRFCLRKLLHDRFLSWRFFVSTIYVKSIL